MSTVFFIQLLHKFERDWQVTLLLAIVYILVMFVCERGIMMLRKKLKDADDPIKVWDREEAKREMNERMFK